MKRLSTERDLAVRCGHEGSRFRSGQRQPRLLIVFLAAVAGLAAQTGAGAFGGTASILAELSQITGFKVLRPVKQEIMNRSQLKSYFESRIQEVVKPEEIRVEELVLKKLGFAPAGFDLKKTTIDLMTEQAAAFYDYRGKKMVMLDGNGDAMQEAALVHELAHALADQHFRLERFLKKAGESDDSSLARTAVMEGQATWLMTEFLARKMGRTLTGAPDLLDTMNRMTSSGSGFPVFERVPLYMRESLVFPYTKGMLFQQEVAVRLGKKGFGEVFRNPPETTREILHPEVYFDGFRAAEPKLPEPPGSGWKKVAEGTLGEFDVSILMQQYAFAEYDAAKSWRGGRYRMWEHRSSKRALLAWGYVFDGDEGTKLFWRGARKVLEKKWKHCKFSEQSDTRLTGEGDDGFFLLVRTGTEVNGMEGLESPAR